MSGTYDLLGGLLSQLVGLPPWLGPRVVRACRPKPLTKSYMARVLAATKRFCARHASALPMAVVWIAALAAAVLDGWKFKIYTAVTLPLLASGLLYHGVLGGPTEFAGSLLGLVFGFGILIGFYVMGGMGAGDVKLM